MPCALWQNERPIWQRNCYFISCWQYTCWQQWANIPQVLWLPCWRIASTFLNKAKKNTRDASTKRVNFSKFISLKFLLQNHSVNFFVFSDCVAHMLPISMNWQKTWLSSNEKAKAKESWREHGEWTKITFWNFNGVSRYGNTSNEWVRRVNICIFNGNFDLHFRIYSPCFPGTVWSLCFAY